MKIGVAILAAGRGERVGMPKALLRLDGQTFLERIAGTSRASGLGPLVIVTAARAAEIEALLPPSDDLSWRRNPSPERGQLSSLRLALESLAQAGVDAALSWPVDHPGVQTATLHALADAARGAPGAIIVPRHEGRGGHPTLFPRSVFDALGALPDDGGARALLHARPDLVVRLDVSDPAVVRDVDTPDDAARAGALRVVPFEGHDPAMRAALEGLFDACGSTCFCRYWHFSGDKNDWLQRCSDGDENRQELRAAAESGSDQARGVVAFLGPELIGWMKVAPAPSLPKLYEQRFYRGLPVLQTRREGVFAAGCALVHPAHRHRGVARALAWGAVATARSWGAKALEAFPRVTKEPVSDEELWMGTEAAYREAGLREAFAEPPYPVLRIDF